jgi:hypothetical protein
MWRGWVRTDRASEYVDYISRTGLAEYRQTPGNLGGFAGDDIERAVFYPDDDEYLIGRETTVTHHEVAHRLG